MIPIRHDYSYTLRTHDHDLMGPTAPHSNNIDDDLFDDRTKSPSLTNSLHFRTTGQKQFLEQARRTLLLLFAIGLPFRDFFIQHHPIATRGKGDERQKFAFWKRGTVPCA
ncbi:uncharacterized protein PV07_06883 [Cladophialophora immunda]|uniref:Uncharacterized protein n=1 Tax=Cladophialophora immunda TaxID=569365 RepID=A0A0D2C7J4_9EURO|nr:uncharacterized protein PV07_06883 [Cladophialophora immunda]KIW27108.1 hypothetical protein PV07_06883 [Cladophialophora immunda]